MPPITPPRILLVDDDPALRKVTARILTRCDFDVTTAENANEAAIELAAHHYDAVICDGLNGDWRAVAARAVRVPFILFSGDADAIEAASKRGHVAIEKGGTDDLNQLAEAAFRAVAGGGAR